MTKNKKYLYTITPVGKQYKDSAYYVNSSIFDIRCVI